VIRRRDEDSTVWIGYADFLTTLTVLFFIVAAAGFARSRGPQPTFVSGAVRDSLGNQPLAGCRAEAGGRTGTTGEDGRFDITIESVLQTGRVSLEVRCPGFAEYAQMVELKPLDTTRVSVKLARADRTVWERITLSGDALFDPLQHELKPQGVQLLVTAGADLKKKLRPGEMIVVQGHTDDLPIPKSYRKTNWMLSGERAAAAIPVLTDSAYGVLIPKCQVSVMGFGPSRPREGQEISWTETEAERTRKRAQNRRIELWRVSSLASISGNCIL
jgi:flagellar motor protein MotB